MVRTDCKSFFWNHPWAFEKEVAVFISGLRINILEYLIFCPLASVGLFGNHHLMLTIASLMKVENVLINMSLFVGSILYILSRIIKGSHLVSMIFLAISSWPDYSASFKSNQKVFRNPLIICATITPVSMSCQAGCYSSLHSSFLGKWMVIFLLQ